ncbi:hypothetical protein [Dyella mobilis]|uniref:Uncharacterized protein n=1 Tax=Dyella mobilis TaxID=1849582 RepID=A0ABS2KDW9_9GAMM|nr:hypothetical protein [Dyella mobilis]MBM7129369.1 hypothetical protein [Dyella mobilis]
MKDRLLQALERLASAELGERMRRRLGCLVISFAAAIASVVAHAASPLELVYSKSGAMCDQMELKLRNDMHCRPFDNGICGTSQAVSLGAYPGNSFRKIAVNEYGYTELSVPTTPDAGATAIVYVERFQGDLHARLVETWKVGRDDLDRVLAIPPGPAVGRNGSQVDVPRETNAEALSAMLLRGRKVADEWSPIVTIEARQLLVTRECEHATESWDNGLYLCRRITALSVYDITPHEPVLQCKFRLRKWRQNAKERSME